MEEMLECYSNGMGEALVHREGGENDTLGY